MKVGKQGGGLGERESWGGEAESPDRGKFSV